MSHHGKQAGAGHYTADVKQPDGRWLRFDDASVTSVPSPAVRTPACIPFFTMIIGKKGKISCLPDGRCALTTRALPFCPAPTVCCPLRIDGALFHTRLLQISMPGPRVCIPGS